MASDLTVGTTHKRTARSTLENDISVLSIWFIAALGVLMLVFVSEQFAEAVALMGQY